jgi:hypothetical protein
VTPPSWAGIITAISTAFVALGGLVTALTVLIPLVRRTRRTEAKVDSVHTIVNQQRTDMQQYIADLKAVLRAAGVAVPVDQSLAPPNPPSVPR